MRVKFEKILCATDLSEFSNFTLPYGIAMAEEFGARLYVCHVVEMHAAGLYAEAHLDPKELHDRHAQRIHEQVDQLIGRRHVQWEPLIGSGYPPGEIARFAEKHQVDLVISATHGRSGIKRLILGSVTERLMRILPCPLLVVISQEKDAERPADRPFRLDRIMVGCDFSRDSSLAFQYALSFAQEFQSDLHLVHVVEPSAYIDSQQDGFLKQTKSDTQIADRLEARLLHMIPEEAENWCIPMTAVLGGQPYEQLARYAKTHQIDMIFLGVRGRGLIETYLIGSTTDRVVRKAPCPVLSVRPFSQAKAEDRETKRTASGKEREFQGDFDLFSVEKHKNTVLIRLHRDLMYRATSLRALDSILDHFTRINQTDSIKSVVIMGAPDKRGRDEYLAFYNELMHAAMDRNAIHRLFNIIDQIVMAIVAFNKVVIHADSGKIISLYLNLSLACDYRIVADNAVFQNPCIELGMIPKGGGPFFLSKMIGTGKAYDILLADKDIAAATAMEKGLVDMVVPPAELMDTALSVADRFGKKPVTSLKGVRRLLNFSHKDLREYLETENQELLSIVSSPRMAGGAIEK